MATIADLQVAMDSLSAEVEANTSADQAGITLLNKLGQLVRDNVNDPAALNAIADAMSAAKGKISTSSASLMEAVLANTPADV